MYRVTITHEGPSLTLDGMTRGEARKIVHLALAAGAQVKTILDAAPKEVDLTEPLPPRQPKKK